MTRQPSGALTPVRRRLWFAPICLAALLVSLALPATAPAQLNQTLHQDGNATNDAFFVRGVKLMEPDQ